MDRLRLGSEGEKKEQSGTWKNVRLSQPSSTKPDFFSKGF